MDNLTNVERVKICNFQIKYCTRNAYEGPEAAICLISLLMVNELPNMPLTFVS